MRREEQIPKAFIEWIDRSLDGSITPEEFARLDHTLATNDAACHYYLEFITTYVSLVDLEGVLPTPADIARQPTLTPGVTLSHKIAGKEIDPIRKEGPLRLDPNLPEAEKKRVVEAYARRQLQDFLEEEHRYDETLRGVSGESLGQRLTRATDALIGACRTAVGIAKAATGFAVVALVLLMLGLYLHAHRVMGTLVETVEAKWDVPLDPEGRIRSREMKLEEGYARIRLTQGAEVILQAPTRFRLQGGNRMFVEDGWITAKVLRAARGFTLHTPDATVVDYGTEFGFLVGRHGQGEVHVFDGAVGLSRPTDADPRRAAHRLTENRAATISTAGRIEEMALGERASLFVRSLPRSQGFGRPGRRLSLADMMGGGFGLDSGIRGQYIDPATGEILADRRAQGGPAGHYNLLPSLPFVDGVFVPDVNEGPSVLSSTGLTFEDCPDTHGHSYETISNRALFQAGRRTQTQHLGVLGGIEYGGPLNPSIGMHPNAGITFDLNRVRAYMPGIDIAEFSALCGISDTMVKYFDRSFDPNEIKVDFWVLVDGKVAYNEKLAAASAQVGKIRLPLGPEARFLTLATSNPGEVLYGWALFAEPALILSSPGVGRGGDGSAKIEPN